MPTTEISAGKQALLAQALAGLDGSTALELLREAESKIRDPGPHLKAEHDVRLYSEATSIGYLGPGGDVFDSTTEVGDATEIYCWDCDIDLDIEQWGGLG